jgi:hypothetical protein
MVVVVTDFFAVVTFFAAGVTATAFEVAGLAAGFAAGAAAAGFTDVVVVEWGSSPCAHAGVLKATSPARHTAAL